MLIRNWDIYLACLAMFDSDIYLASVVDIKTDFCFLLRHNIGLPPSIKTMPDTDFLLYLLFA
jgi:hypothetical protein